MRPGIIGGGPGIIGGGPGMIGGGRGPIAADKQEGTRLPIEGFFGRVPVVSVPVVSNWSQSELFFNGFVAPESNLSLCCDLGAI